MGRTIRMEVPSTMPLAEQQARWKALGGEVHGKPEKYVPLSNGAKNAAWFVLGLLISAVVLGTLALLKNQGIITSLSISDPAAIAVVASAGALVLGIVLKLCIDAKKSKGVVAEGAPAPKLSGAVDSVTAGATAANASAGTANSASTTAKTGDAAAGTGTGSATPAKPQSFLDKINPFARIGAAAPQSNQSSYTVVPGARTQKDE